MLCVSCETGYVGACAPAHRSQRRAGVCTGASQIDRQVVARREGVEIEGLLEGSWIGSVPSPSSMRGSASARQRNDDGLGHDEIGYAPPLLAHLRVHALEERIALRVAIRGDDDAAVELDALDADRGERAAPPPALEGQLLRHRSGARQTSRGEQDHPYPHSQSLRCSHAATGGRRVYQSVMPG